MSKKFLRAAVEISFIIFLFYSNLLMGEFDHSGAGYKQGILWALKDIFTIDNFCIACISGLIGYLVFEFLRKKNF